VKLSGLFFSGPLGVGALLLMAKGWSLKRQDRVVIARLMPIRARVTDAGDVPSTSTFTESDGTQRLDVSYEGKYEYVVGSTTHIGTVSLSSPVFAQHQLPPNTIDAFYDPSNPAISRLSRSPDDAGSNYIRFGMVVLAVALIIGAVVTLGHVQNQPG
jgi:hypothetical protein